MIEVDHVVLDYGFGNANSIASCLKSMGCHVVISGDKRLLKKAKAIYIPGVGSFPEGIQRLKSLQLIEPLNDIRESGNTVIIGICLGMQMFSSVSFELGTVKGLNWIEGEVIALSKVNPIDFPSPHVGWNKLFFQQQEFNRLISESDHFYFDHSYYFNVDSKNVVAYTDYGYQFPAIVKQGKVLGFQFHPEKSQWAGKRLLINILDEFNLPRRPVCLPNA